MSDCVVGADDVQGGAGVGAELVLDRFTGVGLFFGVGLVLGEVDVEDIAVLVLGEVEAAEFGDCAGNVSEEVVAVLVVVQVQVLAGFLGADVRLLLR